MKTKLFLDDMRSPYDSSWDVVRSYEGFQQYILDNGIPDVVSFDHDLSFEHYPLGEQNPTQAIPYDMYNEKTGYHAAQFMVEYINTHPVKRPVVIIHSWNRAGTDNIRNLLVDNSIWPWVGTYPINAASLKAICNE